jgi:hypothetical protein
LIKIIGGFVDNPKRNYLLCCNKIAETMNSNVIFYGLAKIFQGSFLFFEFIQNKFNYFLIILGFFGLFYWLRWQKRFNDQAENNPDQIK